MSTNITATLRIKGIPGPMQKHWPGANATYSHVTLTMTQAIKVARDADLSYDQLVDWLEHWTKNLVQEVSIISFAEGKKFKYNIKALANDH